jgi:hypothetical protein
MATTGKGTPLASGPDEDQVGVSVTAGGSLPADGLDMGATAGVGSTAGAEGAREAQEETHQGRAEALRVAQLEEGSRWPQSWRD